jgi:lipid II isoglutaminyl synthase (glutamine-hydrolysing)
MTDRVGRHAAARDLAETLIVPAQQAWPSDEAAAGPDGVPQRSVGRHASGRAAVGNGHTSPGGSDQVRAPAPAPRPGPLSSDHQASAPARQRRPVSNDRKLRLVWVYPDLLSTYGDRGNLLVLSRRAELRGIEVEAIEVNSDEAVPSQGDIYLMGGGEDLPQILAANRLRQDGGLVRAADRGAVIFAVCAGYQMIGDSFGGVEGEPVAGLGILDISSGRGDRRGVGELVADVDPTLSVPRLTGFENHQGVTRIGSAARPLARVSLGVGNGDGTEGAYAGRVLGTYMHGPALARNPGLADLLLSWAVGQLRPLDPDAEEWAGRLRAERLAAVER